MEFPFDSKKGTVLLLLISLAVLPLSGCLGDSSSGGRGGGAGNDSGNQAGPLYAVNISYLDDTSDDFENWSVDVCGPEDYGVLLIKNEGNVSDTYKIVVANVTDGFEVGLDRDTVTCDNTTMEWVILTYRIGDGVRAGDTGKATIIATSQARPDVSDKLTLELMVSHEVATVTKKGDKVMVSYVLTDENGQELDSGTLPATAGERYVGPAQQLGYIDGFYLGLLGMYKGEIKSIRVPPELGYGTDPSAHELGGQTLFFRLTLDAMLPTG